MKLERIKNKNAMTASEMAMILGGQATSYCAETTGFSRTSTIEHSTDFTSTIYDEKGNKSSRTIRNPQM